MFVDIINSLKYWNNGFEVSNKFKFTAFWSEKYPTLLFPYTDYFTMKIITGSEQ
jgi:hypothetical protein